MNGKRAGTLAILCAAAWLWSPTEVAASDACSGRAVITEAKVTVSDGSQYRTESFFQSRDAAAIRFIREHGGIFALDGPFAWVNTHSTSRLAPDDQKTFTRTFALGHQFHALLVYFDEIMSDVRTDTTVEFGGRERRAKSGAYPFGGTVYLIEGENKLPSPGMRLEFDGMPAMDVKFGDWGNVGETKVPFSMRLDDGSRTFEYTFTTVEIADKSPLWFFSALEIPVPDEVAVYRLHRQLLAAHCLGDAEMIGRLTAAETLIANRGELNLHDNGDIKEQFRSVFRQLSYTAYHDLDQPVIEISTGGDMAWAGVKVRAVGEIKSSGTAFDDQWAWVMLARKIGGQWVNAGIASSRNPQ